MTQKTKFYPKKRKKRKWLWISLGALLLILIGFRIALPSILLKFVNKELTKIEGYNGHVEDIDVWLIRGAYKIKNIELKKTGGKVPVPFFSAEVIDLSVEWKALFHGSLAGNIEVDHPQLNYVEGPTEATSQTKIDKDWTEVVDDLMPLKLNRFEIKNGEIHFRNFHSKPKVDIYTEQVHIVAENLNNAYRNKDTLPSRVTASAFTYGGAATLDMKLNPLNKIPTFDVNARLDSLNLVKLNDFLKAYGKFDVEKGHISIYMEAAAKNNMIKGYTKPIIKDLKVIEWGEDIKNPPKLVWEAIVSAVAWVFKNHPKDQLATKVEFEGSLKKPDINVWDVIGELLRNAFIQALYPSLENSITFKSVAAKSKKEPTDMEKLYEKSGAKDSRHKK